MTKSILYTLHSTVSLSVYIVKQARCEMRGLDFSLNKCYVEVRF